MDARSDHESQVIRALGSIGAATLASRLLGFIRDMVIARAFGAGPVTDAFFVAFRLPNVLRRLLAEGALSTAVVPVFTQYLATRDRADFYRMFRSTIAVALIALTVATLLGMVAAGWLVRFIAPGFATNPSLISLAVHLTRLMFPYLTLVGLSALAMGALNAHGRFFAAALGPAVLNLAMIASVLGLSASVTPPIVSLAIGVLAGGLGQLVIQLPSLRREGLPLTPSAELCHPAVGRIARLMLPSVFGLAAVQVTVFVNTVLASVLAPGSISFLYYADRVMEFPLGIFGIALASAALPAMARQATAGDTDGLAHTVNFALRLSAYVALPAALGLVMLRTPITRVLFQRGEFGAAETVATAWALAWYAIGLPAFSATRITAQAFYALGEPRTPVIVGIVAVGVNVLLAIAFMRPMAHAGLALASSGSAYANLAMLVWLARQRLGWIGGHALLRSLARTTVPAVALAGWLALMERIWPVSSPVAADAAMLTTAVLGGALVFWAVSALVRSPEGAVLWGSLRRRERR